MYRICVYRYLDSCEHAGGHFSDLEDLQRVNPDTDPTVGPDYAWLEIAGGHSVEFREAEDRFQGWMDDLREAGHDRSAIYPKSPSYYVAASDASFATVAGEVAIGVGSIMLARDHRWWVAQGRASTQDMPFAAAAPPESVLWLGERGRPETEQLAWARLIAAEEGGDDLPSVVRTDLEAALRMGASRALDLLENHPTVGQVDPAAVPVLKPDGAGIFAVVASEPGEAMLGRLVHGWNAGVSNGEACLQGSKAILFGAGWDPTWVAAGDEWRALDPMFAL